jgi:hypothetical protein
MRASQIRLVAQLGYPITGDAPAWYGAVTFQPKMIGVILLTGALSQSPAVFLGLSLVLLVGAFVPKGNLFDAIYNRTVLRRGSPLPPAPAPRRFAQGLAGTIAAIIAAALFVGWPLLAWSLQALFAVAVVAVVFGDSCAGAVIWGQVVNWHISHGLTPRVEAASPTVGSTSVRSGHG